MRQRSVFGRNFRHHDGQSTGRTGNHARFATQQSRDQSHPEGGVETTQGWNTGNKREGDRFRYLHNGHGKTGNDLVVKDSRVLAVKRKGSANVRLGKGRKRGNTVLQMAEFATHNSTGPTEYGRNERKEWFTTEFDGFGRFVDRRDTTRGVFGVVVGESIVIVVSSRGGVVVVVLWSHSNIIMYSVTLCFLLVQPIRRPIDTNRDNCFLYRPQ
mmetsp:Transcript_30027/g.44394  ORF Transcript_30027/g.44394 Transcript_30027/m.44394 type:complete len:213 (-) Transcript_30027:150-788(-)